MTIPTTRTIRSSTVPDRQRDRSCWQKSYLRRCQNLKLIQKWFSSTWCCSTDKMGILLLEPQCCIRRNIVCRGSPEHEAEQDEHGQSKASSRLLGGEVGACKHGVNIA